MTDVSTHVLGIMVARLADREAEEAEKSRMNDATRAPELIAAAKAALERGAGHNVGFVVRMGTEAFSAMCDDMDVDPHSTDGLGQALGVEIRIDW